MSEKRESFIVYTEIKEILDELNDEEIGKLFRAMIDYELTGKTPRLPKALSYIFITQRQRMDRDAAKWELTREKRVEAGRKGGIKSGKVRSKQNEAKRSKAKQTKQNEANEAVNVNGNVNVNVNGNVNVSDSLPDSASLSLSLIKYLNDKTGANYQVTDDVIEIIEERLNEGYTESDFYNVIDKKSNEWICDGKMRSYLRPSTLFGGKFQEYLAAPEPLQLKEEQDTERQISDLKSESNKINEKLLDVRTRIDELKKTSEDPRDYFDEWDGLKVTEAALEDQLVNIDHRLGVLGGDNE